MNLRKLFEQIDVDAIGAFVEQRRQEDLHMEFKTVNKADLSYADDRRNLAKALSGFANSDGGLIVWGVNARPGNDGVDCAQEATPVEDPKRLVGCLNEFTGQSVSPIVDGVEHKSLSLENGTGFGVTLVPASDSGPHMARNREDRYYKRSGDSFYKMEHFDIEDMFGRRKKPDVYVEYALNRGARSGARTGLQQDVHVDLYLLNKGRGLARYVYVKIGDGESQHKLLRKGIGGNWGLLDRLRIDGSTVEHFVGRPEFALHQELPHKFHRVAIRNLNRRRPLTTDVVLDWEVRAESMAARRGQLVVAAGEIMNMVPDE
jgi:hypothetical protein